jgi:hypothetical protein
MTNPKALNGPSTVFLSGDDASAKQTVAELLTDIGWPEHYQLDLGAFQTRPVRVAADLRKLSASALTAEGREPALETAEELPIAQLVAQVAQIAIASGSPARARSAFARATS